MYYRTVGKHSSRVSEAGQLVLEENERKSMEEGHQYLR